MANEAESGNTLIWFARFFDWLQLNISLWGLESNINVHGAQHIDRRGQSVEFVVRIGQRESMTNKILTFLWPISNQFESAAEVWEQRSMALETKRKDIAGKKKSGFRRTELDERAPSRPQYPRTRISREHGSHSHSFSARR